MCWIDVLRHFMIRNVSPYRCDVQPLIYPIVNLVKHRYPSLSAQLFQDRGIRPSLAAYNGQAVQAAEFRYVCTILVVQPIMTWAEKFVWIFRITVPVHCTS